MPKKTKLLHITVDEKEFKKFKNQLPPGADPELELKKEIAKSLKKSGFDLDMTSTPIIDSLPSEKLS